MLERSKLQLSKAGRLKCSSIAKIVFEVCTLYFACAFLVLYHSYNILMAVYIIF